MMICHCHQSLERDKWRRAYEKDIMAYFNVIRSHLPGNADDSDEEKNWQEFIIKLHTNCSHYHCRRQSVKQMMETLARNQDFRIKPIMVIGFEEPFTGDRTLINRNEIGCSECDSRETSLENQSTKGNKFSFPLLAKFIFWAACILKGYGRWQL
jgi:hypothetical protein